MRKTRHGFAIGFCDWFCKMHLTHAPNRLAFTPHTWQTARLARKRIALRPLPLS